MVCPNCKLINPDTAARCDCGYNFETKAVESIPTPPVHTSLEAPATAAAPPPAYTLFNTTSVTIATLLGSPAAGAILMAINYRRLGKKSSAVWVVVIGVLGTIAAAWIGTLIPSAAIGLQAGLVGGMYSVSRSLQEKAVNDHEVRGGRLGSRWVAAGVGLAVTAVLLSVIFLGAFAGNLAKQNAKVTVGTKDTVFYSGSATAADATALGAKLKDSGYFTDKGVSAEVSKDAGGEAVSFIIQDGTWNQPQIVLAYELIGLQIAPAAGGLPLRLRLANASRQTQKEITVDEAIVGSKDQVCYFGSATLANAMALGQVLKTAGFFMDKGSVAMISKDGGTVISLVVADGVWDQPTTVASLKSMIHDNAADVGGLPVTLRLLSSPAFDTKLEVPLN